MSQRLSDKYMIAGSILLLAIIVLSACHSRPKKVGQMEILTPREQLPVLATDSVTTLISDSGITRYRIESPRWLFFDKTDTPYQEFPKNLELWTLRGNVHALNWQGEQFDTQELKWDQRAHRVYSDSSIHITREKSIIEGVGFVSNEQMTKYTILHPTGVFPVKE